MNLRASGVDEKSLEENTKDVDPSARRESAGDTPYRLGVPTQWVAATQLSGSQTS